jgi:hypothetical protein
MIKQYIYMWKLCFVFFCSANVVAAESIKNSQETLFSVTPEQMVFAAKLSESYRKLYCHKFSTMERQEALDHWKESSYDDEYEELSPDQAVRLVVEAKSSALLDPL